MLQKITPPSEFSGYNLYTQILPKKIREMPKRRISEMHKLFSGSSQFSVGHTIYSGIN